MLGIQLCHTRPYTPQGRGKIERWFRYVRENFISVCPDGLSLDGLNDRFSHWLEDYHNKVHSSTQETPNQRYIKNMKCVRPAPPRLLDYFRVIEFRRVKADRTFRLNGTLFEAPVNLIDERVEVRFHQDSPEDIEIFFNSQNFGKAVMLDRHVNFKIGRNSKVTSDKADEEIKSGELFNGGGK